MKKHLHQVASGTDANSEDKADKAFEFPQGIAGFPGAHRFAFLYDGQGDIICLQSLDCPEIAFLLTPWDEERLGPPPKISQERRECLQLAEGEAPFWMLVLNPFADKQWVTANLQAPVAINMQARLGLQCIRVEEELPIRYQWMPQPQKAA
ncbi:MAG: flagellar assembly protein FliW [Mariprofundaceae bacterium]|nr:flagellar assembly protein FliW [Mariprofundaceae bacterium]